MSYSFAFMSMLVTNQDLKKGITEKDNNKEIRIKKKMTWMANEISFNLMCSTELSVTSPPSRPAAKRP